MSQAFKAQTRSLVEGLDHWFALFDDGFFDDVDGRARLHDASWGQIRSVFPPAKGIRLVGVTLSIFLAETPAASSALALLAEAQT